MVDMNKQKVMLEAAEIIGKIECSPVKMSFGYVLNNICQTGLVIHECAPVVINKLIEAGFTLDMRQDGLHVYKI